MNRNFIILNVYKKSSTRLHFRTNLKLQYGFYSISDIAIDEIWNLMDFIPQDALDEMYSLYGEK